MTATATLPPPLEAPPAVGPDDVAGSYAFYDDGWPGRLLVARSAAGLDATLRSYRFGTDHRATVSLGRDGPHHVEVVVHEFNELAAQAFDGWFFTSGGRGLAGSTDWKGQTFGFYARRTRPHDLARRTGPCVLSKGDGREPGPAGGVSAAITPATLAGVWAVCCAGWRATLDLQAAGGGLTGVWHDGARSFPVAAAAPEPGTPEHLVVLDLLGVDGPARPPRFRGHLFTRPRNAMAGTLDVDGTPFGCYLTRVA